MKKLLLLAFVLPIMATNAIAYSKLSQSEQITAQLQLDQTMSVQETEEFRKLLVDYYAAWSIPNEKPWNITNAEKFYQLSDRMFGFDFNPPAEVFKGGRLINAS